MPNINGADGRKLSKRHGAVVGRGVPRRGLPPAALVNFLALLGWSYDDKTELMSRDELVERFTLERVGASPATFDYKKLDWMNGVYLRALTPEEYADALVAYLREQGHDWDEALVRRAAPLVQAKIARLGEFPEYAGLFFEEPDPQLEDGGVLDAARDALADVEPVHRRGDRGGAARGRRTARALAAEGVPADPGRGHGLDACRRACSRASSCSARTSRSSRDSSAAAAEGAASALRAGRSRAGTRATRGGGTGAGAGVTSAVPVVSEPGRRAGRGVSAIASHFRLVNAAGDPQGTDARLGRR